jgi:hypothetical protein
MLHTLATRIETLPEAKLMNALPIAHCADLAHKIAMTAEASRFRVIATTSGHLYTLQRSTNLTFHSTRVYSDARSANHFPARLALHCGRSDAIRRPAAERPCPVALFAERGRHAVDATAGTELASAHS